MIATAAIEAAKSTAQHTASSAIRGWFRPIQMIPRTIARANAVYNTRSKRDCALPSSFFLNFGAGLPDSMVEVFARKGLRDSLAKGRGKTRHQQRGLAGV